MYFQQTGIVDVAILEITLLESHVLGLQLLNHQQKHDYIMYVQIIKHIHLSLSFNLTAA